MKLVVFTVVLNGFPWLPSIYTTLNRLRLSLDWHWIVVEGTALNTHCSSHCQQIEKGLSTDGSSEFLYAIAQTDERVTVISKQLWDGKIEMVNAAIATIKQPCVLIQMDADEVWTPKAVVAAYSEVFGCSLPIGLNMRCDYFVGPGLRAISPMDSGTDLTDWVRVWKFNPGQTFRSHCPPVLEGVTVGRTDLSFQHYAYVLEQQVRFKQRYYGFSGMLDGWHRLQAQEQFPVKLRDFWPYKWVDDGTTVHKI